MIRNPAELGAGAADALSSAMVEAEVVVFEPPPPSPEEEHLARLQAELEGSGRGRDVLGEEESHEVPVLPLAELNEPLRVRQVLEALLLVAERPLPAADLARALGRDDLDGARVRVILEELEAEYRQRGSGVIIVEVGGGFQLRTAREASPWIRAFTGKRPVRLSRPALEVLSIIAYRQPCTRGDVEAIRGVDSGAVVKSLLERGLVRIIGRKEEPGRPMTYGTSRLFLQVFGLRNLADLPSLREFADLGPREEWEGQSVLEAPALPGGARE